MICWWQHGEKDYTHMQPFFHKDLKDDMEANHIFYAIQRSTVYVIKFMLNTMSSGDIKSGMSVEWEKEGT